MRVEYIYVIQTREFISQDEPIYKIGRTSQEMTSVGKNKRLDQYPKGSVQIAIFAVRDCKLAESEVIKELKLADHIKHCKEYGNEYFEGQLDEICHIVLKIALEHRLNSYTPDKKPEVNQLQCKYCLDIYSRIDNLDRHIKTCKERNDLVRNLEIKLNMKVDIRKDNICRFCNKEYTRKYTHTQHLNTCKKKQEYQTKLENML